MCKRWWMLVTITMAVVLALPASAQMMGPMGQGGAMGPMGGGHMERGRCGFIGLTPALSGADLRVGEEA